MPPGDVRNCLVALAGRRRLAEVFDYRFEGGTDLRDHTVGNIIIAALADMSGGFCEGVQQAARLLRVTGRVYPSAAESLTLVVRYTDGTVTRGEAALPDATIAAADPRRRWRARSGRTGAARQPRPRRRLPAAPLGTGALADRYQLIRYHKRG